MTDAADPNQLLLLSVLKADPVLRLLVAHSGFEDGGIPFEDGWAAFKIFAALPSSAQDGGATLQVTHADANPKVLEIFMGRQLSGVGGYEFVETRIVGIHFMYHAPEAEVTEPDDEELWSTDFPTLADFFASVEGSPAFFAASQRELMMVTFFSQEDTDEEAGEE